MEEDIYMTYTCVCVCLYIYIYIYIYISYIHTGCPRRNVPDFGRVFLTLKCTDITQKLNGYEDNGQRKVWSSAGPHTLYLSADKSYQCLFLCVVSDYGKSAHTSLIPECAVSHVTSVLAIHVSCIVLGILRTIMTCVRVFL